MPLKIYDSKEAAPEALRATAIELKDGKWAVDEPDAALGDQGAVALQRERDARKAEKARADAAERERDELRRTADAKEKGVSEAELQKIRADEAASRKPIEDELALTKAENIKLKLTDRVQALYLKHGGLPDRTEDAMDQLTKRTSLGDEGGIVYKDKDGKVTADSAETFFPKFKAEKPFYFAGTGASGSGGSGSSGSGGEPEKSKPDPAREEERARTIAGAF